MLQDFDVCVTRDNTIWFADTIRKMFVSHESWESFDDYTKDLRCISEDGLDINRLDICKIYRSNDYIDFKLIESHNCIYDKCLIYSREHEKVETNNWATECYTSALKNPNITIVRIGDRLTCTNTIDYNKYATIIYNNAYSYEINAAIVYTFYLNKDIPNRFEYEIDD